MNTLLTQSDHEVNTQIRRRLFYEMLRIRLVEETVAERYAEQEMRCPVHLSIGQEAIAVGVCAALESRDTMMSSHRAHAHYLAKGGDLKAMVSELYGKVTGCSSGKGGSMHLVDLNANMLGSIPIVGSSLAIAVGVSFGSWMKSAPQVTVAFFGEAATEEGIFFESMNFAALKKLPILFVCENNFYSTSSPLSVRQSADRDRAAIARAHGMEGIYGDGNDVESVHRLAKEAVVRAREGRGPTYLEFETYRWREHCGPNTDWDLGYRTQEEFLEWRKRCPVETYRSYLFQEGELSERDVQEMTDSIRREISEAFQYAKASPFPPKDHLLSDVYVE